jgi:hypothetical protein
VSALRAERNRVEVGRVEVGRIEAGRVGVGEFAAPTRCWWHRPVAAVVIVLAVYTALALTMDQRGHLGGDAGSKVAVLHAVATGEHPQFDVGYWAFEHDPELRFHPLYYTAVVDGRAQQLSTLPMVWLARPLHAIGGDRLTLALPMFGGILCALAARALAQRLGARDPWVAYWVISLASPVAIYSIDVWEHTLGLAGMLWGVIALFDAVESDRPWAHAVFAGLSFGIAATMRTEALVYAALGMATAVAVLLTRRVVGRAIAVGWCASVGVASMWIANDWFERIVLGAPLRSARAADVVSDAGTQASDRVNDAWVTLASLNYADLTTDRMLGALILVGLLVATWSTLHTRTAGVCIGTAAVLIGFGLRLGSGLSFIPGLVPVFPLAAVGAVIGVRRAQSRVLTIAALAAMPLIWVTAYAGMPGAQWGGRYLFASGVLFAVAAIAKTGVGSHRLRVLAVAMSVVVTGSGILYLRDRTLDVGRATVAIASIDADADVVIARVPFLWRELGSTYDAADRHLTVVQRDELDAAAAIARDVDASTIAVVQEANEPIATLDGYRADRTASTPWIGRNLTTVFYESDLSD